MNLRHVADVIQIQVAAVLLVLIAMLIIAATQTKHEEVQREAVAEAGVGGGVSETPLTPLAPRPAAVGDGPGAYIVPPASLADLLGVAGPTGHADEGMQSREVTYDGDVATGTTGTLTSVPSDVLSVEAWERGNRSSGFPLPGLSAAGLPIEGALSGAGSQTPASGGSPSRDEPHLLEVTPEPSPYASLAACGVPCWGERMTHAEVAALALRVTGDAAWSSWAAWCFSTPGGESGGYVAAVAGPNRNGTYDLGFGQSNTATLAGLGYDAERVLVDVEYAMDALYATWLVQGYGAWFGCAPGGGAE